MILAPRVGSAAVDFARRIVSWRIGMCQMFVRTCQGVGPGAGTALEAWRNAGPDHQHGGKYPPPGVNVHWQGGPGDPGHTALSVGDGRCRSTDYPSAGLVGEVSIGAITRSWFGREGRYLGWTDVDNGTRTWQPPGTVVHTTALRTALRHGGAVRGGAAFKRELADVVGRGAMLLGSDRIGPAARRRARRLEATWHPDRANGVLSDSDLRRLGQRRNAFRIAT